MTSRTSDATQSVAIAGVNQVASLMRDSGVEENHLLSRLSSSWLILAVNSIRAVVRTESSPSGCNEDGEVDRADHHLPSSPVFMHLQLLNDCKNTTVVRRHTGLTDTQKVLPETDHPKRLTVRLWLVKTT